MENFETYNAVDFAQNESFIGWVQGRDAVAMQFWEEWLAAHPEKKEIVQEARGLVLALKFQETSLKSSEIDNLWNTIEENIAIEKPAKRISLVRRSMAVAASLLVLVAAYFVFLDSDEVRQVANNKEWPTFYLPDNSLVEMNAGSSLSYNKASFETKRVLELEGEAQFTVEKGDTFLVKTQNGSIEVIGTVFNVYTRSSYLKVDCFEGSVRVKNNSGDFVILTQEESVVINRDTLKPKVDLDPEQSKNWRQGFFYFDKSTYGEAFDELERQFNITILASETIRNQSYNGFFENTVDIDTAIDIVLSPSSFRKNKVGRRKYEIIE